MAREDPHFRLRIPAELLEKVAASANRNRRSTTAEIVQTLEAAFASASSTRSTFDLDALIVATIAPAQIRAARALLDISAAQLAAAAGLSVNGIGDIERGKSDPKVSSLTAIYNAFAARGVAFIPSGVRLK